MTLEQAIQKILDKKSQAIQLNREIEDTKKKLKELTPIKVGEKVLVDGKHTLYVSDVEYTGYGSVKYQYRFTKPKKDGTMGQQGAGIWSYKTVERI